jgi:hypothetical protein
MRSAEKRPPGSIWFRAAAWLSIVTAIGHTIGNHTSLAPAPTPEVQRIIDAMKQATLPISHKSFWLGFMGDSLNMGVLLAAFGFLNLLFERVQRQRGESVPAALAVGDLVVTLVSLVITAVCFPLPPLVMGLVALGAYGVTLAQVLRRRETSHEAAFAAKAKDAT